MIDHRIIPRTHDVGGFEVRRALPSRQQRMVGPFIFLDAMGPGEFLQHQGIDVRPHPHIGLSTLTYLFSGSLRHQDSLGYDQLITPGAVNVMCAGRGITHSERTDAATRAAGHTLFGIQSWLALPEPYVDADPAFNHIAASHIPELQDSGCRLRLIAGEMAGLRADFPFPHPTLYADLRMAARARFVIPATYPERAIFILSGDLEIDSIRYPAGELLILHPHRIITLKALSPCHLLLLGGEVMDGPRHIWWNFVSPSLGSGLINLIFSALVRFAVNIAEKHAGHS